MSTLYLLNLEWFCKQVDPLPADIVYSYMDRNALLGGKEGMDSAEDILSTCHHYLRPPHRYSGTLLIVNELLLLLFNCQ